MRLQETTLITANPFTVWPFIADPVLQADWNPKIVSVDRARSGPVRLGERFDMIYQMSNRENLSNVEVTALEPLRHVAFLHHITSKSAVHEVEVTYDITQTVDGVQVLEIIDLSRAAIPWLLRPIISFIHRFGWTTEEPYLARLKRLAEQRATGVLARAGDPANKISHH